MLAFTLFMLVSHILLNVTYSTRLPLEVYELTPSGIAGVTELKHKTLEYSTVDGDTLRSSTAIHVQHLATKGPQNTSSQKHTSHSNKDETKDSLIQLQLDRRRSRQMLDIMKQQQHHVEASSHKLHTNLHHLKDVRILYQVGDSEGDLPVCAPYAVCSKIDLYETPWIERQCRCPYNNRSPEIVIHHHHKDPQHVNHNNEKYHNYYEHNRMLHPSKHLLLTGDFTDKKFDNLHLKKLMHKLGAVYEDDLHFSINDYGIIDEENSALPESEEKSAALYKDYHEMKEYETEYGLGKLRRSHLHNNNVAHMRHSGHINAHQTITYIGGCPSGLGIEDGHTIADKTRHYKMCQPVHRLPVCRHFRDYTWTLTTSAELNTTEQIVHCRCPKASVTYLTKREPLEDGVLGYRYLFACSPLTRLRCQRKQPCKLFTVRKRQEFIDEVNINSLCQCPKGHHCPTHHTQSGVIAGETFLEDNIQTYSGYCMAND